MDDAKTIRLQLGFTQEEMAKVCNTGIGTVRKWDQKDREPRGQAVRLFEVLLHLKSKYPPIYDELINSILGIQKD
jgi:DNA-binding transcriptional regulator YiaG